MRTGQASPSSVVRVEESELKARRLWLAAPRLSHNIRWEMGWLDSFGKMGIFFAERMLEAIESNSRLIESIVGSIPTLASNDLRKFHFLGER